MRWPWQRDEDEMPSTPASARDERLSAYLDGALTRPQQADLNAEAERDAEVRIALEGMRAVRSSLGTLGFERAPRSFTLQPGSVRPAPALPRLELFARVGAVAAALALTIVSVAPGVTGVSTLASKPEARPSFSEALKSTGATRDAATAAADARKQAEQTSGARAAVPATGASESAPAGAPSGPAAPAAAPPTGGSAGVAPAAAGGANAAQPPRAPAPALQAPQAAPAATTPSAKSAADAIAPESPSKPAIREPAAAGTPLPPVPLQRLEQAPLWLSLRIVLAVATSVLGLLAAGLWLRRRGAL